MLVIQQTILLLFLEFNFESIAITVQSMLLLVFHGDPEMFLLGQAPNTITTITVQPVILPPAFLGTTARMLRSTTRDCSLPPFT
jgi:hypothetical protein